MSSPIPFQDVRRWMFQTALPLWAQIGVDRARGGFVEKVDFEGQALSTGVRRVRVAARQTYVFAHAAVLGWEPGLELSAFGSDTLTGFYLGAAGGWPRTVDEDNRPVDLTPDLYDLAFVLFAYAWRHRAARDSQSLEGAHRALDFIEARLKADRGFWHQWPPQGPRLQNPHMHLLEACLAAFEACGDPRFLTTAREIVALFRNTLFDGVTLGEFFDDDWRRDAATGDLVEPGHQLEWAWILVRYGQLSGEPTLDLAERLVAFAEAHGVDAGSGRVRQVLRDDGSPVDSSSRTWPNTERIKGHLALFEATGQDPREAVAVSTHLLLDQYLATAVPGLWMDHFDADGAPMATEVPASTLYHLFLAFAELLRLEPRLTALD